MNTPGTLVATWAENPFIVYSPLWSRVVFFFSSSTRENYLDVESDKTWQTWQVSGLKGLTSFWEVRIDSYKFCETSNAKLFNDGRVLEERGRFRWEFKYIVGKWSNDHKGLQTTDMCVEHWEYQWFNSLVFRPLEEHFKRVMPPSADTRGGPRVRHQSLNQLQLRSALSAALNNLKADRSAGYTVILIIRPTIRKIYLSITANTEIGNLNFVWIEHRLRGFGRRGTYSAQCGSSFFYLHILAMSPGQIYLTSSLSNFLFVFSPSAPNSGWSFEPCFDGEFLISNCLGP